MDRKNRKTREGVVVSNKMAKTVVVRVDRTLRHPEFEKVISQAKKYYAHVEGIELQVGDRVTIVETRPLSRLKRWRVVGRVGAAS
jgi:small subunit ribosomal protein S17